MIALVLQQLDKLRVELDLIDPRGDLDAADHVADIACALQMAIAASKSNDVDAELSAAHGQQRRVA